MRFPFILVFPQRYKIFWLGNKIPLSLPPSNFAFMCSAKSPHQLMHKNSDICGVGTSETWNLKGLKHPDVSQDLFCQQKIWKTLRQFSGECQKPGSCQAVLADFKGCRVTACCFLCCNSKASRTHWACFLVCQDVSEGKEEGSAFSV